MKPLLLIAFACSAAVLCPVKAADSKTIRETVRAVAQADRDLKEIPFNEVVEAATGKHILPFDLKKQSDRELLSKIGVALDEVLRRMNTTNSTAQQQRRINEVSSHFEDEMQRVLNETPGFSCDFPHLASGKIQRSGYPDLRLVDEKSGRIVYLDPKLYEDKSRASSLRTFYFEPKTDTNKILDDAHHLIVGFAHDGKQEGHWKFLRWELVDLAYFKVRLKAEFQGSNRDLYQESAIVGRSGK